MTEDEFPAFEALMSRLRFLFRSRATTEEFTTLSSTYFRALQGFPLADVVAGADAWIEHGKFFPRPAEWRKAIPRKAPGNNALPAASDEELWSYRYAATRGWEDTACLCRLCVAAGVSDMPRRYVPDEDRDGHQSLARDPQTGKTIIRGHWLHGEPLALWYLAREKYRDDLLARRDGPALVKATIPQRLKALVAGAMERL